MALLPIYSYPDSVLRKKAQPINKFDEKLKILADNMLETMYISNGIGLAANQIGLLDRILVIDIFSGEEDKSLRNPHIVINPEITLQSGENSIEEGCLSLMGITAEVKRSAQVTVKYNDIEGNTKNIDADDILAICLQHEMDHLEGILFIDRISNLKRQILKKKLSKLAKKKK